MFFTNHTVTFDQDPTRFLDFEFASNDYRTKDIHFYISPQDEPFLLSQWGIKNYALEFELPNEWFTKYKNKAISHECQFDKIFTIDPLFCKQRNVFLNKEIYVPVFFPFSEKNVSKYINSEKRYDVCISAGEFPRWVKKMLSQLYKLNLRICIISKFEQFVQFATHSNVSYKEKLDLIAQSKISICWNDISVEKFNLSEKEIFDLNKQGVVIKNNHITQHKSRIQEAAFCKSLIICKRDAFNIIEDIYNENENFHYINGDDSDVDKILSIVTNYKTYQQNIESTYQLALEKYTTKAFYEKYIVPT